MPKKLRGVLLSVYDCVFQLQIILPVWTYMYMYNHSRFVVISQKHVLHCNVYTCT